MLRCRKVGGLVGRVVKVPIRLRRERERERKRDDQSRLSFQRHLVHSRC